MTEYSPGNSGFVLFKLQGKQTNTKHREKKKTKDNNLVPYVSVSTVFVHITFKSNTTLVAPEEMKPNYMAVIIFFLDLHQVGAAPPSSSPTLH